MNESPEAQGHAPRSGRYVFSASFAPGQLTVWVNGNSDMGAFNPTDFPMDVTFDGAMSRLDAYRFEAVPGPLYKWNVEYIGE